MPRISSNSSQYLVELISRWLRTNIKRRSHQAISPGTFPIVMIFWISGKMFYYYFTVQLKVFIWLSIIANDPRFSYKPAIFEHFESTVKVFLFISFWYSWMFYFYAQYSTFCGIRWFQIIDSPLKNFILIYIKQSSFFENSPYCKIVRLDDFGRSDQWCGDDILDLQ